MPTDAWGIAVVGATGLAGREVVSVLHERQFPMGELRVLGSLRTAGKEIEHEGGTDKVARLGPGAFEGIDIAFFAAGPSVATEYGPQAADAGAVVIDLSSRFRLDPSVPLVVPEINAEALGASRERGIVASPSSTAVGLGVVLAPLAATAGLRRVTLATYQGAAGAGQRAIGVLARETVALLNGRARPRTQRIAFNCAPRVGAIEPGGATTHELQVREEVRRLLGDSELPIQMTAVRVPIFFGVGMAVSVETERPLTPEDATVLLRDARGVLLHEEAPTPYPTPAEVVGSDATHVGRVRIDPTTENGLSLWIALDGVRKGAALNATQIAEILVRDYL